MLFPLAWLIEMGCSPLLAGRALVLGTQLATAGLLLWGGWRLASWRAGALAALLFLTSPDVFDRIHYTGILLVALTASACVLFSLRAQPLRAGLCMGLTLASDQHGLVVCGIAALLTVVRRPRDAFPFGLGALGIVAIVFGGVWALGGRDLWESLVGIHLFHLRIGQGVSAQFWEKLTPWLYEHGYLFAGAGLALLVLGRRHREAGSEAQQPPSARVVRALLVVVGAHVAVVLAMMEAVFLYVVVIFPVLALIAGMGFDAAVAWWHRRRQLSGASARRASRAMLAGAAAVATLIVGGWAAARSHRESLDRRKYSFWPHVRHGQVARFLRLDAALRGIGESMLPEHGTIFGDTTIVSALALHSGRRVSAELADLNPNWMDAGTVRPEEVVSRIERDGVTAVISPPWGPCPEPLLQVVSLHLLRETEALLSAPERPRFGVAVLPRLCPRPERHPLRGAPTGKQRQVVNATACRRALPGQPRPGPPHHRECVGHVAGACDRACPLPCRPVIRSAPKVEEPSRLVHAPAPGTRDGAVC
ncbi:MAG: hypothetical protein JXP73_22125 [Deltaproteobacteria bacterium]|nr:hypothetical protein [Deltaproteobacteria bacterium]